MLSGLNFTKLGGVVTVVTQDAATGTVLMVAQADPEALERTVATGEMHYHSRTRGLWHKGATSGNVQRVVSLTADCDGDAVLARVNAAGPACHTGAVSCFDGDDSGSSTDDVFRRLDAVIAQRAEAPGQEEAPSYTRKLLADRNLRLKKLGEECAELITACADGNRDGVITEGADLIYHTLVALRGAGVSLSDITRELAKRRSESISQMSSSG
jgi:phosphoribosyl-ATP pyrophosphohydrolase/phosphoribosyl-AMP cyclohydrolase